MKTIDIITLFPEMLKNHFSVGVLSQAIKKNNLQISYHTPRDFTEDRHKTVDDRPFGGGEGMVLMVDPLKKCIDAIPKLSNSRFIFMSPQGKTLTPALAKDLAHYDQLIFLCGRYEGVDERFINAYEPLELSIGDYVLSGGEMACAVTVDVISRFYEGVLGNPLSYANDSFEGGVLKAPQFTRPEVYNGVGVPQVLMSGNHKLIADFRRRVSLLKTRQKRPDLFAKLNVCESELRELEKFEKSLSDEDKKSLGIS